MITVSAVMNIASGLFFYENCFRCWCDRPGSII